MLYAIRSPSASFKSFVQLWVGFIGFRLLEQEAGTACIPMHFNDEDKLSDTPGIVFVVKGRIYVVNV